MSASGKPQFKDLYEPKVPGFVRVAMNDLDAVRRAIHSKTAAVMLEPIQGESGVVPFSLEFLRDLRKLCTELNVLLIFDEIDTNVGGEIAHAVGAKMRTLGRDHQVICITHLPQVAATASSHFVVTKDVVRGRTFSQLHEVNGQSRQEEITRMLGGKSESALELAASLLKVRDD